MCAFSDYVIVCIEIVLMVDLVKRPWGVSNFQSPMGKERVVKGEEAEVAPGASLEGIWVVLI